MTICPQIAMIVLKYPDQAMSGSDDYRKYQWLFPVEDCTKSLILGFAF